MRPGKRLLHLNLRFSVMVFAASTCFGQTTIRVPADKSTIQAAILSAANGDTVLVSPGTYREHIDFSKKAIAVRSVAGAETTIIDGSGQTGAVVKFTQGEGLSSVLQGFTIRGGSGDEGGGITIQGSSPSILANRIVNNSGCSGAGIGVGFGSPLIQGNTISNNSGKCGGLGGGGVAFRGESNGRVLNNVITGNSTTSDGGGIVLWAGGPVTVRDNVVTGNSASGKGGALATVNSAPATIVGNLFAGNSAGGVGGLFFSNPPAALVNNTIAGNQSATTGDAAISALQTGFSSTLRIVGNLVIAAAGQTAMACGSYSAQPLSGTFKNNDVFAPGAGNAYASSCVTQTGAQGNISADPQFLNPAAGNYRLQPTSPARNAGDPTASELGATDLDGNPRLSNARIDIGAYQYPGPTSISLSAPSLVFPQTPIAANSSVQAVTITNTGSVPLQIASISISGDFSHTSTCPASGGVAPGANCLLTVTFSPTARGARSGSLTIVSNAAASPTIIPLSGTAIGAAVSLSTNLLTFPNQLANTNSAPQQIVLTNNGESPLSVSSVSVSADFAQSNTCGTPVEAGATCAISVVFRPLASGTRTGTLTVTSNAAGSPHTVNLAGNGQAPVPSISSISPAAVTTGGGAFTLIVRGGDFLANSVVLWSGSERPTTFVSTTQLTAAIPAADIATGGAFSVVVFNPAPGGGRSNTLSLTVGNPIPAVTSLSPSSALAGGAAFQLTVTGANFVSGAEVRWDGNARPTALLSPTQLRAEIAAADISFASTHQVTVFNPAPGGGISGALTFSTLVPTPLPVLTSISPASATAGDSGFTLTLTGSGFVNTSSVRFANSSLPTTYVSDTELRAAVAASDLKYGGSVSVRVVNPSPGGGTSATQIFTINGNPLPAISAVSPSPITGGAAGVTLTVNGSGFTNSSVVQWNGSDRSTSFVSSTQLTAVLLADDTASAGTARVGVVNPPPGGGASQTVSVTIAANPTPAVSSLLPAALSLGTAPQAVQVRGSGFTKASVIRWNGQDRATTLVDSSTLSVLPTADDLAVPGLVELRVFNPPLGGGTSAPVWFAVTVGVTANGIVYDPARRLLWASVPSSQAKHGNSVVSIDPLTGALGQPIYVGSEPGKVVISDDGSYLYVALTGAAGVRRVDLAQQKADLQFALGSDSFFGSTYVDDMDVMPGNPHTIAVSRRYLGVSPRHAGVAIFDDGVMRKNTTQTHTGSDRIEFSSAPNIIYGFNNETTEFGFRILTVDDNGVKETQNFGGSAVGGFGGDMKYDGGRIYAVSGAVLNPDTGALLGKFGLSGNATGVAPDHTTGRTFFTISGSYASSGTIPGIAAFDNRTFVSLGVLSIPGFSPAAGDDAIIRWGDDGLAIRTSGQVYILRSPMVKPPTLSSDAVLNAAGFAPGPVAAGSIATLFGTGLAPLARGASATPLPTSMGGIAVTVNSAPSPLFYVSPGQVNFQVPWEIAGRPNPEISVGAPGFVETAVKLNVAAYAPGIFTNGAPDGQAIAVIANTTALVAPASFGNGARPARPGEILTVYCTGLGPVDNPPMTGWPAPSDRLIRTTTDPAITIGGRTARVLFSGLAPGMTGVYQINVEVPSGLGSMPAAPISIVAGGVTSNSPTIAVQ